MIICNREVRNSRRARNIKTQEWYSPSYRSIPSLPEVFVQCPPTQTMMAYMVFKPTMTIYFRGSWIFWQMNKETCIDLLWDTGILPSTCWQYILSFASVSIHLHVRECHHPWHKWETTNKYITWKVHPLMLAWLWNCGYKLNVILSHYFSISSPL